MSGFLLTLLRGDDVEGTIYELPTGRTTIGRSSSNDIAFQQDLALDPVHCTFLVTGDRITVRDEGNRNGVYLQVRSSTALMDGHQFLCGEQVFRFERYRQFPVAIGEDGAVFSGTPVPPWRFRVVQILDGGETGLAVCAHARAITIGREGCDMNFMHDPFMSYHHARLEERQGHFILTDLQSTNGVFVKIQEQHPLEPGDSLFMGRQLFRLDAA
jgi:predicted component of type VI protein secretion system